MNKNEEFFRSLGIEPPEEENDDVESRLPIDASTAIKHLILICATIRDEAINYGFSAEEAYDMVMSYYTIFLGTNFAAAQDKSERGD